MPRANLAISMWYQLFVNACQKQVTAESAQVAKIVHLRPHQLLSGTVSQHPANAHPMYLRLRLVTAQAASKMVLR